MELKKLNKTAAIIKINRYFANGAVFAKVATQNTDNVIEFYGVTPEEITFEINRLAEKDETILFSIIDTVYE